MTRPELTGRTGARYLVPAVVSPGPVRSYSVQGPLRPYLAATLATAFRGRAVDALAAQLREQAKKAQETLGVSMSRIESKRMVVLANQIRDEIAEFPVEDRVSMLAHAVRELLVDAPECCVALDISVREACDKRYGITARQAEIVNGILSKISV